MTNDPIDIKFQMFKYENHLMAHSDISHFYSIYIQTNILFFGRIKCEEPHHFLGTPLMYKEYSIITF